MFRYIKRFLNLIFLLILILLIGIAGLLAIDSYKSDYLKVTRNPELKNNSYLIWNVNIVPMTGDTLLSNKTILIKDGIITAIADSLYQTGIEIIDGKNSYLSPGLVDMHVHLWDKQELGLYLAGGVTSIRNLWGYPMHLRIKKKLQEQQLLGPRFYLSGPKLTGKNDYGDDKVQVDSPEKARELVQAYKARGFDCIKIYAGITPALFDAVITQSIASDISIVAHPSRELPFDSHFHSQIKSIEHAEEIVQQALNYQLDSLKLESIIEQFVSSSLSFCPTLTGYYKIYEMLIQGDSVLSTESAQLMNPLISIADAKAQYGRWSGEKQRDSSVVDRIYSQHKFHLYIIKRMHEEGVNIVCGTDAGIGITTPGSTIHQELKFYTDAGMSNYEALKTATVNPAKTHKFFMQSGTVEPGKQANFIFSEHNPLEDLAALKDPEWIMLNGRKIDRQLLAKFEKKAKQRKNLIPTALRYLEYLWIEK